MGTRKTRLWAKGCGGNPAYLGIKWHKPKAHERHLARPVGMTLNGPVYEVTLRNGKKIVVPKDAARILIDTFDAVREAEYNHNMGEENA